MKNSVKSVLSLCVVLAIIICAFPSEAVELSGNGTEESPYLIGTKEDLAEFRDRVNAGSRTINAKLTADIDLCGSAWTPIGGNDGLVASCYSGTFDGDGYTISNFQINATKNYAGFFSYLKDNAHILNLNIDEAYITSSANNVGGMAGTIINGTIENCSFSGTVTNTKNSSGYAGGIAGYLGNTKSTSPEIKNCVNYGTISGPYAGGITSYAKYSEAIQNCYNKGAITGKTRTGGIVGQNMNGTTVTNCYNIGTISGTSTGGITGWNGVSISNCYWTNPESASGGGSGTATNCEKITSASGLLEKLGSSFAEDTNNINDGYPILKWQTGAAVIEKDPHIVINGSNMLYLTNSGSQVSGELSVSYIDMEDEPEITWSVSEGDGIISLTAPEEPNESNTTVIVNALQPGNAVVSASANDEEYTAQFQISVMPYVTTAEIDGRVYSGETVSAKVYIYQGYEYDFENYPSLEFQWGTYSSSGTFNPISGETKRNFVITDDLIGENLTFRFYYNGEYKAPSRASRVLSDEISGLHITNANLCQESGGNVKYSAVITNVSGKGKNIFVIIASYDNDGKVLDTKLVNVALGITATKEPVETEYISTEGAATIKGYIWDAESLSPAI